VTDARSGTPERADEGAAVRVTAPAGAPPLGAIFGGIGLAVAAVVGLVGLDRLPIAFCVFKGLTGWPCPTCGSTRAVGRLFGFDLAEALAMNPLTTVVAVVIAAWAVADLVLLPRRRSLRVGFSPAAARWLRVAALLAFLSNWVYLLVAGR
jgi:hypothetical protein